jgi:hypothetical protein
MFHATSMSSAASDAMGRCATIGASRRTEASTTSACTTHAMGDRAPLRTLVAVRASAPVAAMPPNSGAARLARP